MGDSLIDAMVRYQSQKQAKALRAARALGNPKARVRCYLLGVGAGKCRTGDLAALLDVRPSVVRGVLKAMKFQYGALGRRDGFWYATPDTPVKGVRDA